MNKFTTQFLKYIIILLVVGGVLVAIGVISVGRNAISNMKELALSSSSKEKIDIISNENLDLKLENKNLTAKAEFLTSERDSANKKSQTLEAYILLEQAVKEGNMELAKECIDAILPEYLPEIIKPNFEKLKQNIQK